MTKPGRQRDGRPNDHARQNRQVRDAAKAAGLSEAKRHDFRRLVERLSREEGEDLSYADLAALAREVGDELQ